MAEEAGAEVVLGDWPDESLHRRTALAEMNWRGYKHIFIPDGDEVPEPKLIEALVKIAKEDLADVGRVRMDTYWRDAEHVIRPREELAPVLLLDCHKSEHQHIREYSSDRVLLLGPEYGVLHHLSYAGPDERIERKISTWGHRHEVAKEWFNRSWKGWEADPLLRNLHPTHPHVYGSVERIEKPEILAKVPNWREETVETKKNWPKVSVVIPLHGGPEDIAQCLDSIAKLRNLIHETIVVDDVSPDNAAEVSSTYDFVTLFKNETNLGFAGTCNKGFDASTGSVILFLNSDTIVPKAGLISLIESLMESGTIGAAGPLSNNVGYHQRATQLTPASITSRLSPRISPFRPVFGDMTFFTFGDRTSFTVDAFSPGESNGQSSLVGVSGSIGGLERGGSQPRSRYQPAHGISLA